MPTVGVALNNTAPQTNDTLMTTAAASDPNGNPV